MNRKMMGRWRIRRCCCRISRELNNSTVPVGARLAREGSAAVYRQHRVIVLRGQASLLQEIVASQLITHLATGLLIQIQPKLLFAGDLGGGR